MSFDVIVCGSLHLDIVMKAPALPRIDETMVGHSWQHICGGKGGNQAVQAALADAKTAMIGRIGADEFGTTLSENLKRSKIDISNVSVDSAKGSGMSVAILQDDGDYGAVIVSGANTTHDPAAISKQWSGLAGAKVLILQNEIPEAVNLAAAKAARGDGAKTIFNAAPARAITSNLLDYVDVLVVNRIEAEALSGHPVNDFASARAALPKLSGQSRCVVITLGGEGLVVAPAQAEAVDIPSFKVKVTSTHGAGDCFVGTLAAELARGALLVAACHAANVRAAEFVSRPQE